MGLGTRKNLEHFRDVLLNPLNTGNLFQNFRGNPCLLATLRENELTFFMTFSVKVVYETRKNLEHFRHIAVNSLNPGLIFLFYGFVVVGNVMVKRTNGFL